MPLSGTYFHDCNPADAKCRELKENQFLLPTSTFPDGVPPGGFHGNHHIAQDLGIDMSILAFAHGKGNDIGRLIPSQIAPVYFPDLFIIRKKDADVLIRTFEDF